MSFALFRVLLDGCLVVLDGFLCLTEHIKGVAQIIVHVRQIVIQVERFTVMFGSFLRLTHVVKRVAKTDQGLDFARIVLESLFVVLDCVLEMTRLKK